MDRIPGSKDEQAKPKTAIEAAMLTIAHALEKEQAHYSTLSVWRFKTRFYLQGVMAALALVLELLHNLHHHYDNSRGELN